MAGTENASSALAVWNALKPKIRQLIREETRSAVRKKKMTIQSINTANQSVTVYEAANPNVALTLQYRKESGVGAMSAGQSVTVEWIYDDLSTAVVSGPGQGWSTDTLDAATAGEMFISSNNPTLTWTVGSTGSTELRNSGPTGNVGVSFVTKATSDSSVVFQTLVNSDGTQNWVPPTRTVNSKALSANITLSASDVGAVPTARTVNSKALSSNIALSASDVSALPNTAIERVALSQNGTHTFTIRGNLGVLFAKRGASYYAAMFTYWDAAPTVVTSGGTLPTITKSANSNSLTIKSNNNGSMIYMFISIA